MGGHYDEHRHLPGYCHKDRRVPLCGGAGACADREIHLYQAIYGDLCHPQHRQRLSPGTGHRRAAPVRQRPDHHDGGAQVRPRGGGRGHPGGGRHLFRAAHRQRRLYGQGGHGAVRGRDTPDGDDPLVGPGDAHGGGGGDRHPKGHRGTLHRGGSHHHRRLHHRYSTGGLSGAGGAGHHGAAGPGKALCGPAQLRGAPVLPGPDHRAGH